MLYPVASLTRMHTNRAGNPLSVGRASVGSSNSLRTGLLLLGLLASQLVITLPAQSAIVDGSFEDGTISGGSGFQYGSNDGSGNPTFTPSGSGWSFSNNSGLINQTVSSTGFNPPSGGAQSGTQFALLQGGNAFDDGENSYDLDTTFKSTSTYSFSAGVTYEISFYQASRGASGPTDGGALSYSVKLSNGQTLFSRTSSTGEGWAEYSADFTVSSSGDYNLLFFAAAGQGDKTAFFDNVSISAVPEPSESVLVGSIGLLGFAAWRRTNRRVA